MMLERREEKALITDIFDVVVIGAGTMGLLNAQVAKAFGAHVIISELTPKKLELARSFLTWLSDQELS